MQDAFVPWAGDLLASPTGDIALASGTVLSQQRLLRRLLTNPGDAIWDPTYGGGLARYVGAVVDPLAIRAAIRAQIFKEVSIARLPEPVIDVRSGLDGSVFVQIRYVNAADGGTEVLGFSIKG
jgi:phage baseplate assembly protein W